MAQIVTITNPLTGQPTQVDQLEHTAQEIDDAIARALPGGAIDTLLAGKAPSGYGLGLSGSPSIDDCDTATKNGWYHVHGATLNKPFNKVGALLVACRASSQMYQLFFVGETYDTGGSCIIVRSMYGGEWGPWEWVNPPMQLGVEYRTTERYKGKPVYIKAVDTGALPNATFKFVETSFPNANAIVDYGGEAYQDGDHFIPLPCLKYGSDNYNNEKGVQVTISNGYGITIATMTDFSSFTSSSVWVKYTKSTD